MRASSWCPAGSSTSTSSGSLYSSFSVSFLAEGKWETIPEHRAPNRQKTRDSRCVNLLWPWFKIPLKKLNWVVHLPQKMVPLVLTHSHSFFGAPYGPGVPRQLPFFCSAAVLLLICCPPASQRQAPLQAAPTPPPPPKPQPNTPNSPCLPGCTLLKRLGARWLQQIEHQARSRLPQETDIGCLWRPHSKETAAAETTFPWPLGKQDEGPVAKGSGYLVRCTMALTDHGG